MYTGKQFEEIRFPLFSIAGGLEGKMQLINSTLSADGIFVIFWARRLH